MISIPSSYAPVFTAPSDGIYVFTVVGAGELAKNGQNLPFTLAGASGGEPTRRSYTIYLSASDVLDGFGGGQLAGVRLGDELFSE